MRIDPLWHNILVCEEWPGAAVPLWFRLSSDAPLRRVWRPRCLADRGGRRVRTDVTSHLNARPASRCYGFGSPQPATEFVAQRCSTVVDPMCREPGSDDIDAVQRKHRNEQMALNPLAQLVPDRAVIPGVINFLYINQSVKVNFVGYFIVDFLRWIFYAAAKQIQRRQN